MERKQVDDRPCGDLEVVGPAVSVVVVLPTVGDPVVVVAGEADLDTAGRLGEELAGAVQVLPHPCTVDLDVAGLVFCDTSGLDALHAAQAAVWAAGSTSRLVGAGRHLAWMHQTFPGTRRRPGRGRLTASA